RPSTIPPDEMARLTDEIVGALKSVYDPEIPADIYVDVHHAIIVDADLIDQAEFVAASMGSLLLAAGQKGLRFALLNASIWMHQPKGALEAQVTEIMLHATEILNLKKRGSTRST